MQKHTTTSARIFPVFICMILLTLLLLIQYAYAFTYESQDWWFARESQETQPTGDLGIIFTYPDRVIENDTIDVNVRIEYMNNENAQGEYAILDDVKIHLRNNNTRLNGDIYSSENETSPILRPGEIFNHSYSIPSQDIGLQPGNYYAIDLSFTVVFGMKTTIETYYWDSGEKVFSNSIEPQELRPFQVVAKNSAQGNELTLRVSRPIGLFEPIVFFIDDEQFNMTGGPIADILVPDSTHNITLLNETIPLLRDDKGKDVMRAKFTSWSDGDKRPQREVHLNQNTELFAIYTTQYYLDATAEVPSNASTKPPMDYLNNIVDGEGWVDAGSEREFKVQNLGSEWLFDHWTGNISSGIDPSSPSNSITMDGPKTIQAQLKPNDIIQALGANRDLINGVIASAIIGPLAAYGLSLWHSWREKKKNLIYLNTYIPMIKDILRQNIKEKDVCLMLLDQKRNEITKLLQAGIINIETFRVLNEHLAESFKEIFDANQNR